MADAKRKRGSHPLPKISEEMKAWSAALEAELTTWPSVSTKPMFGMTALYRGKNIFGVLPKTRGFETSKAVGFRLYKISAKTAEELKSDPRVVTNPIGAKWVSFEIAGPADLNDVLRWMELAYRQAK